MNSRTPSRANSVTVSASSPASIAGHTRYIEMLLEVDHMPWVYNIIASVAHWVLLAGYLVIPDSEPAPPRDCLCVLRDRDYASDMALLEMAQQLHLARRSGIYVRIPSYVSVHVAGLETSRELRNELEEKYRRLELNTFCELFAQVRETTTDRCANTREFVDRIGPEYVLVVDAIQNDKDPVNPSTIGNRLAYAEQTVQRKEAATFPHRAPGSSSNTSINSVQKTARKCAYCEKRSRVTGVLEETA
ncbi:hypothetical protein AKAW_11325 [Aspergillus luchuensis IFO 4308]|nr:hypothetical protein AKAW_11325 [Aspergillus luchuensis IFO 4308]